MPALPSRAVGATAAPSLAEDFDPESEVGDFTEPDGWTFASASPTTCAGRQAVPPAGSRAKLDTRFSTPELAVDSPLLPLIVVTPIGGQPLTITASGVEHAYVREFVADGRPAHRRRRHLDSS